MPAAPDQPLPAGSLSLEKVQRLIGGFAVYMFALSAVLSTAGIYIFPGLMVLALLLNPRPFLRFCRDTPLVWVAAGLTTYIAIRTVAATYEYPDNTDQIIKSGKELLMIAGIPAVVLAWFLAQDMRRAYGAVLLYILALVVFFFMEAGWDTLQTYLAGETQERLFFGGHSNLIGTFYATGLLGILTVGFGLLERLRHRFPTWALVLAAAVLTAVATLFLLIVFWNQGRTVWIALAISLVGLVLFVLPRLGTVRSHPGTAGLLSFGLLLVVAGAVYANWSLIEKRTQQLTPELQEIIRGEVPRKGFSGSLRSRYWMNVAGAKATEKRPFWGWGPGNYDLVVKYAGPKHLNKWDQIHNLYIQLATGLGIAGLAGFAFLIAGGLRGLAQGFTKNGIPLPVAAFAGAAMTYFLILSLAQIRHDDPPGQAYLVLLLGLLLTGAALRNRGS